MNILQPGPGVGGHCIAVDPWFIVSRTPEEARLIRTAREVNDSKPRWVLDKVKDAVVQHLAANPEQTEADVTIACYGLAFKPDIDDLRYLGARNATLIFRDGKSYERGKFLLRGRDCRITQSADAAFMLPALGDESCAVHLGKYKPVSKKRLLVCASVLEKHDGAVSRLVEICREAADQGYEILGWHSEIRPSYDLRVREMADWDSIQGFRWLPPEPINTNEVAALIRSCSIVIATRMHPAIIAVSHGVAAYGIATNGKMETVFEELKMPYSHASKLSGLTFSEIARRDFSPSFVMAARFGQEAERGGRQVLEVIQRGWISATDIEEHRSA